MAFEGQSGLTAVELVEKPCRFGGSRLFFRCPRCGRRILTIYWPESLRPGCRVCLHLVYRTQRASRDWMYYAQLRIEALVQPFAPGWEYGDELPAKPPRVGGAHGTSGANQLRPGRNAETGHSCQGWHRCCGAPPVGGRPGEHSNPSQGVRRLEVHSYAVAGTPVYG